MKLIKPTVEIWQPKSYLLEDVYKHIERCARVCYKSEDKITEDSYRKFVNNIIKSNHLSVVEHGTIYLTIPIGSPVSDMYYMKKHSLIDFFFRNPYSICNISKTYITVDEAPEEFKPFVSHCGPTTVNYITTNLRVLLENDLVSTVLPYMGEASESHEKRYTFHVITDIGVSREFNRHRKFSISEQSTRYCNYTKDRFGNELTFTEPAWVSQGKEIDTNMAILETEYIRIEKTYNRLINNGWKPQQARQILPLGLKTEVVYTGFYSDWQHFLELRTSKAAHPNMQVIANKIKEILSNQQ